jgi:AraC family transcriptional regulator
VKSVTLRDYKQRLLRVLVHVQQHLDEPLPLTELARIACLSPHHFHRVFSGMIGEPLHEHIRRLRLERAAIQLKLTRLPVVQVALGAGFNTHEAFTRAFRATFGRSPSEYRRVHHGQVTAASKRRVHYRPESLHDFPLHPLSSRAMNVQIVQQSALRVAFVRNVGPYHTVGHAWERLCTELGRRGFLGTGARFIGICYDDPTVTGSDRIRYDACATVGPDFQPEGDVGVQTIPGGDFARLTHFGPYERLSDSYGILLGQWLPRSGRELRADPSLEEYMNSPENTEPKDLVTDIYAPLAPLR